MKTLKNAQAIGFEPLMSGRAAKFEVNRNTFFLRKKGLALEFGVNDHEKNELILEADADGMENCEIVTRMIQHMAQVGFVEGSERARLRVTGSITRLLGL